MWWVYAVSLGFLQKPKWYSREFSELFDKFRNSSVFFFRSLTSYYLFFQPLVFQWLFFQAKTPFLANDLYGDNSIVQGDVIGSIDLAEDDFFCLFFWKKGTHIVFWCQGRCCGHFTISSREHPFALFSFSKNCICILFIHEVIKLLPVSSINTPWQAIEQGSPLHHWPTLLQGMPRLCYQDDFHFRLGWVFPT